MHNSKWTQERHECLREILEERVAANQKKDVRGPVKKACEEVSKVWKLSPATLRKLYYEYQGQGEKEDE